MFIYSSLSCRCCSPWNPVKIKQELISYIIDGHIELLFNCYFWEEMILPSTRINARRIILEDVHPPIRAFVSQFFLPTEAIQDLLSANNT